MQLCGVHQLLDAALAGYNVTIFAYGVYVFEGSGRSLCVVCTSCWMLRWQATMSSSLLTVCIFLKEVYVWCAQAAGCCAGGL
eukprot:1141623-Pelagomonas_calceolata.AAC.4